MKAAPRRTRALIGLVGIALSAAGPVMLLRGRSGRKEIRAELTAQRISFPDHGLPAHLARFTGCQVRTGIEAHAYADLIKDHLAQATGGLTYAEITDELHAEGGEDDKLVRLRQTAFMGETLRGSLLSACQALAPHHPRHGPRRPADRHRSGPRGHRHRPGSTVPPP
ncbi:hypothetical protein [Streptomyces sp. MAI_2237]